MKKKESTTNSFCRNFKLNAYLDSSFMHFLFLKKKVSCSILKAIKETAETKKQSLFSIFFSHCFLLSYVFIIFINIIIIIIIIHN